MSVPRFDEVERKAEAEEHTAELERERNKADRAMLDTLNAEEAGWPPPEYIQEALWQS